MAKIQEAIALYATNLVLFSLIIVSVRLPANILTEIILLNLPSSTDEIARVAWEFRLNNLSSAIFDPIYVGALVHCLWQIKQGGTYNYRQAITVGFQNWGKLFTARFIAGFFVGLGLICFIIPGVILALRYSLIEPIVVGEGYGNVSRILKRSNDLTQGRKVEILGVSTLVTILVTLIIAIIYVAIYLPIGLLKIENNLFINIIDILVLIVQDLVMSIYTIILFLFYWQARGES
jgi:hypothetical protein